MVIASRYAAIELLHRRRELAERPGLIGREKHRFGSRSITNGSDSNILAHEPTKKNPALVDPEHRVFPVGKWRAPVVWKPSLLAGLLGIGYWLKNPVAAYDREREQFRNVNAYRKLKQIGYVEDFNGYPITALPPQYDDLLNLYLTIKQRRPKVVLELGGGYSTIVIARAVSELEQDTVFWSVDASEYWQGVVKTHMPSSLRTFVNYHHAKPILIQFRGERICAFGTLPVCSPNFIYIDGGEIGDSKDPGGDALLLEENAPDDFALLVDGRRRTVAFLKRALRRHYSVGPGPLGVQTLFVAKI